MLEEGILFAGFPLAREPLKSNHVIGSFEATLRERSGSNCDLTIPHISFVRHYNNRICSGY